MSICSLGLVLQSTSHPDWRRTLSLAPSQVCKLLKPSLDLFGGPIGSCQQRAAHHQNVSACNSSQPFSRPTHPIPSHPRSAHSILSHSTLPHVSAVRFVNGQTETGKQLQSRTGKEISVDEHMTGFLSPRSPVTLPDFIKIAAGIPLEACATPCPFT